MKNVKPHLDMVSPTDTDTEKPEPTERRRWLDRALVVAGVVAVVLLMAWCEDANRRAIRDMPVAERHAFFTRSLQNFVAVCTAHQDALHGYCADQASLPLQFSECDQTCQDLASRQLTRAPRPR
jgi:hypothetical protein